MNNEEIIKELLEKLKQCDDFHNRCDFLMEHSEITYMLDYITNLQQENQSLKKENKILRENAEHNDKVVNKVNWENLKLKEQVDYLRRSIERKEEIIMDVQNEIIPYTHEYVTKLINRQNNFIEYLENEININPYDISDYTYEDIINTILSKYEEIIEK